MMHYLILGAGVAGRRAVEIILKRDTGAEIILVDQEPDPFYYKPLLGESIAKGPKCAQLAYKLKEKYERNGIRLVTGVRVKSLDIDRQELLCTSGEVLHYDRLLIASGSKTVRPAWDNGKTFGTAYLDSISDAQRIASAVGKVRRAVVSGSSVQAMDALRGLSGRGIECIYLLAEDRLWPGVLDPVASEIIEDRIRQEGITVIKQSEILELVPKDTLLKGVVTTRDEKIATDLLIMAAPQAANLDFLPSCGLDIDLALVVDASLRTSRENIFAAGDVAQPLLAHTHEHVPQPGWLNAWRQGNIAGMNMSGETASYQGVLSLRARVFDLDVVCLGISDAGGPGIREESGEFPYAELPYIYKKIVYKGEKVVGAIFIGDVSEAGHAERWVRERIGADQCENSILTQMFNVRSLRTVTMGALCPVCKFQIQMEETYKDGDIVTCPACGIDFRLKRMPNGVFRAEPISEE